LAVDSDTSAPLLTDIPEPPAGGGGVVSDVAYDATAWNGVTDVAPSKNAIRDKIETLGGSGDVVGPASATDLAICIFDGTTGKLIKVALVTIDASGHMLLGGAQEMRFRDANTAIWSSASTALRIKGTAVVRMLTGLFEVDDATASRALFTVLDVASAVNNIEISPSISGQPCKLRVGGADANIGLNIVTAGTGRLQENGANVALEYTVATQTAATRNETATKGQVVILCDCTANAITVNLPTAVGNKAKFHIKKTDATANTVTIDGATTETIDGSLTAVLKVQNVSVELVNNNANWFVV